MTAYISFEPVILCIVRDVYAGVHSEHWELILVCNSGCLSPFLPLVRRGSDTQTKPI